MNMVILTYQQEKIGVAFVDVIDVQEGKYTMKKAIEAVNDFMGTKLKPSHFQKAVSMVERYLPGETARKEGILGITVTKV